MLLDLPQIGGILPQMRAAIEAMPQLVWIAQPDGTFEYFNHRWLKYTGQTQEQALRWGFRAALHPDDLQPALDGWQDSLERGEPFDRELQLRRASDSAYIWHLARAVPIVDPLTGRIERWVGTATDISDQKRETSDTVAMLDLAMDSASRQQTFLREVLASLTTGGMHLCDSAIDLPMMRAQLVRGFSLTADTYGPLRQEIRDLAQVRGFSAERAMDLSAAVGEAAMNALIYCSGGTVRVHTDESNALQIWIEDAGPCAQNDRAVQRDESSLPRTNGHGYAMIVQLVDRIWLLPEPDGTTVVLEGYPE